MSVPPVVGPESAPEEPSRFVRRIKVVALVLALLVAGGVGILLVSNKTDADAAVVNAVTSALNDRTASLTVGGSVDVAGISIPITGTGSTDFSQNAMQIQISVGGSAIGTALTENAVYLDKVIYINMGDLVGRVLPGKSWLSLDLSQLSTHGSTSPLGVGGSTLTNDPMAILKILGQDGNTATALGPSTINGDPVEGYAVTVNEAAVRAQLDHASSPLWMQHALALVSDSHAAYKIYVNNAGLLDRMSTELSLAVSGQTVTEGISMDFSRYGLPVSITAPSDARVAPFAGFLQAAQALASTSAT
jgi:hypothetical protein